MNNEELETDGAGMILEALQEQILSMNPSEDIDAYTSLAKSYTDLYRSREQSISEICKINNEYSKAKRELDLQVNEIDNECSKVKRELDIRLDEITHKDAIEKARITGDEKKSKLEFLGQIAVTIFSGLCAIATTVCMIKMHNEDKQFYDEELLTNPESKEQAKRTWNWLQKKSDVKF